MATPTDDSYAVAAGVRAIRMGRGVSGPEPALMRYGALIGQSNMQDPLSMNVVWPSGDVRSKAFHSGAVRRIGNIADSYPPGTPSGTYGASYTAGYAALDGDALVYFANALAAIVGGDLTLYPHAIGGTTIATWLTGGSSWTPYAADVAASGVAPSWAIWLQGESNAGNAGTDSSVATAYAANLVTLQSQLVAQSGRAAAGFGFGIVPLGPCTTSWTAEGAFGPMRAVQVAHGNSAAGAFVINAGLDASLRDGVVHWTQASHNRAFLRYAEWVRRWSAGSGGQLAGPRITGATRSGAQVTVTVVHAGGTALVDGAGGSGSALAGFRIFDGGAPATIVSTAILSANSVRLTLSAVPTGVVTLDFAMSNLPFGSQTPAPASILYDNVSVSGDTLGIPLQPKAAFTVT